MNSVNQQQILSPQAQTLYQLYLLQIALLEQRSLINERTFSNPPQDVAEMEMLQTWMSGRIGFCTKLLFRVWYASQARCRFALLRDLFTQQCKTLLSTGAYLFFFQPCGYRPEKRKGRETMYVRGNHLIYTDPTGHFWNWFGTLIGLHSTSQVHDAFVDHFGSLF